MLIRHCEKYGMECGHGISKQSALLLMVDFLSDCFTPLHSARNDGHPNVIARNTGRMRDSISKQSAFWNIIADCFIRQLPDFAMTDIYNPPSRIFSSNASRQRSKSFNSIFSTCFIASISSTGLNGFCM